ncbi:hypothetical protein QUC31_013010 [Theobroma cacao]
MSNMAFDVVELVTLSFHKGSHVQEYLMEFDQEAFAFTTRYQILNRVFISLLPCDGKIPAFHCFFIF